MVRGAGGGSGGGGEVMANCRRADTGRCETCGAAPDEACLSSTPLLMQSQGNPRALGAFGFAAMFRSGAYDPVDSEMVAAKFEALGMEIERLTPSHKGP